MHALFPACQDSGVSLGDQQWKVVLLPVFLSDTSASLKLALLKAVHALLASQNEATCHNLEK